MADDTGIVAVAVVANCSGLLHRFVMRMVDNPPMRFEHLVQINDSGQNGGLALTRAQIWAGLMHRVEDARPFLPGLDVCEILSRGEGWVERRLVFGTTQLKDRASWVMGQSVRFDTATGASHRGGSLTVTIEEPEAGCLFLRFVYHTEAPAGATAEDAPYEDFLRQAYQAADMDTVKVIRRIAQSRDTVS